MDERETLAKDNALPEAVLMEVSAIYVAIAEKITGKKLNLSENPKAEIIEILDKEYGLII